MTTLPRPSTFALAALALAVAAPSAPAAPRLHERVLSTAPTIGLTSTDGYVAWLEGVRPGKRRLVVVRPDGKRRSAVLDGNLQISLRRAVDVVTGREVTRVVVTRTSQQDGSTKVTYRSPDTLRRLKTTWPAVDPAVETDRGLTVRATSVPDTAAVRPFPSSLPATQCQFAVSGGDPAVPALPAIPDCAPGSLDIQRSVDGPYPGALLTVQSVVPSLSTEPVDKGSTTTRALDMLAFPGVSWRRIGTTRLGYDLDDGIQAWCSSYRGVAVVEGAKPDDANRRPSPWTLRWVPANPALSGYTLALPQLDPALDGINPRLACSGTTIYAQYARASADATGGLVTRTSRWTVSGWPERR